MVIAGLLCPATLKMIGAAPPPHMLRRECSHLTLGATGPGALDELTFLRTVVKRHRTTHDSRRILPFGKVSSSDGTVFGDYGAEAGK